MRKCLLLLILMLVVVSMNGQQGYFYGDDYIKLVPDSSVRYVQRLEGKDKLINNNSLKNELVGGIVYRFADSSCLVDVNKVHIPDNCYSSNVYSAENGYKIMILPRIAIKMKKGYSVSEIISRFSRIISLDKEEYGICVVNCLLDNSDAVLELNEKIHQMEIVEWCEPMMITEVKCFDSTDTYYPYQYYLHNTGQFNGIAGIDINVENAWNSITVDDNLIVAVIDCGVERNHEDLSGNVLDGMTIDYATEKGDPINDYYYYNNSEIKYESKGHGTSCAGIIASKNNDIGIRGVASGVKILPINISPYTRNQTIYSYTEKVANAIRWAYLNGNADIISCSMGFPSCGLIEDALNDAMDYGRNGKGTIVVCASGNSFPYSYVSFPASLPRTIAVGAIDNTGYIWNYSCRGNAMSLVAPSGQCNSQGNVYTTDRMGDNGYNPVVTNGTDLANKNYTQRFGGTSAACPQVAGVAALILSVDSGLSEFAVRNIMEATARKLSGMNGQNWDSTYGYGLVDAFAAVSFVPYWTDCSGCTLNGPNTICQSSTGNYSLSNVPVGATVSWSFNRTYGTTSPQISPNSSNHTCKVYHLRNTLFEGILKAEVKIHGYTVATYTKRITGDAAILDNYGFYWDGDPSAGVYEQMLTEDDNWATSPNTVYVTAPNVYGKTVMLMRSSSPNYWWYPMSNGVDGFKFEMPDLASGETLTIKVTGGCQAEYFVFRRSNANILGSHSLNVSAIDNKRFVLSLPPESAVANKSVQRENIKNPLSGRVWLINIYNTESPHLLSTLKYEGDRCLLDASEWKPGLYLVKAVVDDCHYSTKIIVKK